VDKENCVDKEFYASKEEFGISSVAPKEFLGTILVAPEVLLSTQSTVKFVYRRTSKEVIRPVLCVSKKFWEILSLCTGDVLTNSSDVSAEFMGTSDTPKLFLKISKFQTKLD
jgi:hypothetical protein